MYNVAIITASDKGYAGEREDKSGQTIEELVTAKGLHVAHKIILPDDRSMLRSFFLMTATDDDLMRSEHRSDSHNRRYRLLQKGRYTGSHC